MRNKKKLFSLIEKKMPEKDLFSRIENKIEVKEKRKFNKPLFVSLLATCSVVLVAGSMLFSGLNTNNNFAGLMGETSGDIVDATTKPGTSATIMNGGSGVSVPEVEVPGGDDGYEGVESPDVDLKGGEATYDKPLEGTPDDEYIDKQEQYEKTLTATEYSDFDNYSYWVDLVNGEAYDELQQPITQFKNISLMVHNYEKTNYVLTTKKIDVLLKDKNDNPLPLADVSLYSNQVLIYEAVSNAKGVSYLYHNLEEYEGFDVKIQYDGQDYWFNVSELNENNSYEFKVDVERVESKNVDIVFFIDTTGSMGDELSYIQQELVNIIDTISEYDSSYSINVGLCFYRDQNDAYVTKVFDFDSNINNVLTNLNAQRFGGGGDYEEAIQDGLKEVNKLSWRENSTKLVYHIFDAPCHEKDFASVYEEYYKLASIGARYIPVASSGLSKVGEYIAREGSLLTGGTYTSLTDDSGIGGGHIEISTPSDTAVEYLNDMIVRLTIEFITGQDIEPTPIGN